MRPSVPSLSVTAMSIGSPMAPMAGRKSAAIWRRARLSSPCPEQLRSVLPHHLRYMPADLEQPLFQQHGRFADIAQGLLALVIDAGIPGNLLLQLGELALVLIAGRRFLAQRGALDRAFLDPVGEAGLLARVTLDARHDLAAFSIDVLQYAGKQRRQQPRAVFFQTGRELIDGSDRFLDRLAPRGDLGDLRRNPLVGRPALIVRVDGASGPNHARADLRHLTLDARPIVLAACSMSTGSAGNEDRQQGRRR